MLDPVGFWSYTRHDDAQSDGQLSQLRVIVGKAISLQFGADVTLWQDVTAIPFGADWAETIEETLGKTTFFMPIVTPRFLKSEKCFEEYSAFRRRMEGLGRKDLVFPVHYVSVDRMTADDTVFGESLDVLRRHQWIDFRPLFYIDPRAPEVRLWAGKLAESILATARRASDRIESSSSAGDDKKQTRNACVAIASDAKASSPESAPISDREDVSRRGSRATQPEGCTSASVDRPNVEGERRFPFISRQALRSLAIVVVLIGAVAFSLTAVIPGLKVDRVQTSSNTVAGKNSPPPATASQPWPDNLFHPTGPADPDKEVTSFIIEVRAADGLPPANQASGRRTWKIYPPDRWAEIYPDGIVQYYDIIGRFILVGCKGTAVRNLIAPNHRIFIPDKGCPGMPLYMNDFGDWGIISSMYNIV